MGYTNDMKTEAITTERQLNEKLAELQIRTIKSRAKKQRQRFYGDVIFLVFVLMLFGLWLSVPHIANEELGANIANIVANVWQVLPFFLIVSALTRVIANKPSQSTEEM